MQVAQCTGHKARQGNHSNRLLVAVMVAVLAAVVALEEHEIDQEDARQGQGLLLGGCILRGPSPAQPGPAQPSA